MNKMGEIPRQKNQMPLIIGGAVVFVLLIVIIAAASGGKGGAGGKSKGNAKTKNWTQQLNEARRLENEGINLFVGIKDKLYNASESNSQESQQTAATLNRSIQLMTNAQKIYSKIETEGGRVPDRGQLNLTLKEARSRTGQAK